ncbi:uncharacterized protein LOC116164531 [Photinus pyralis]|uniref:uncharacterized protein LOC116164531 n=1 Tax=Photinus pyralis TaxID=7054 RepID=UPI0012676311|nr:uncharacterized protein LOC116162952 isoform X2 [Photinus pyralis]XP_031334586.1 uncharacterized protein LOC116164531 [Photinus pyralis]
MKTLKLTILLAFSIKDSSSTPSGKPEKHKSHGKQKKDKRNPSKRNSPVTLQKPEYMYEVDSPIGSCHVEYEILPGRPKYQIDVVCWKTIAKVYTLDGHIALKTCVKDDLSWVPVYVTHVFNDLDVSDIFKLHGHVINYIIMTNPAKLGNDAKKEKNKTFFINQKNLESPKKFSLAYDYDPNVNQYNYDEEPLKNFIEGLIWECAEYPGKFNDKEVITKLKFLDYPLHEFYTNQIIDRIKVSDAVMFKSFAPSCPPPSFHEDMDENESPQKTNKKSKGKGDPEKTTKHEKKKDKSQNANKDKGCNAITIRVSGEGLYTDPDLAIYSLTEACGPLGEAYVLMSTNELLTKIQKNEFNSLIIKINKITNLPLKELILHGFKDISVRYNVPFIAQCTTVAKPLEQCITFNEGHAHFLPGVPKLKFLEFIQTGRLIAEIRGRREQHFKTVVPSLFGFEANDKCIGRKVTIRNCKQILERWNVKSTMVTLAVACFNVSSLLKPSWFVEEAGTCHHPDALLYKRNNYRRYSTTTINNINLEVLSKLNSGSPLTEVHRQMHFWSFTVTILFSTNSL